MLVLVAALAVQLLCMEIDAVQQWKGKSKGDKGKGKRKGKFDFGEGKVKRKEVSPILKEKGLERIKIQIVQLFVIIVVSRVI